MITISVDLLRDDLTVDPGALVGDAAAVFDATMMAFDRDLQPARRDKLLMDWTEAVLTKGHSEGMASLRKISLYIRPRCRRPTCDHSRTETLTQRDRHPTKRGVAKDILNNFEADKLPSHRLCQRSLNTGDTAAVNMKPPTMLLRDPRPSQEDFWVRLWRCSLDLQLASRFRRSREAPHFQRA